MNMLTFADQVAETVIKGYNELSSKGKPCIRSNGVKEWTVLAGMVAIDDVAGEFRLLSIGTGLKATPDVELIRSQGRIVHDCHAEIVCLRAFNALLLKEFQNVKGGRDSFLVEQKAGEYFKIKEKWNFAMYISKIPCGDAIMGALVDANDAEIFDYYELDDDYAKKQYIDPEIHSIIRGRANYALRSVVRTKPGRADSNITLSKSCSDKLTMKQLTSLCNSLTWCLLNTPVYLNFVILPKRYENQVKRINETFSGRLKDRNSHNFEIQFCNIPFPDDKHTESQQPCLSSCLCLFSSIGKHSEIILNGVKLGFYVKGNKPLRKNCQSCISRYALWNEFKKIKTVPPEIDYLSFKSSLVDRINIVTKAKKELSPCGWISTYRDTSI